MSKQPFDDYSDYGYYGDDVVLVDYGYDDDDDDDDDDDPGEAVIIDHVGENVVVVLDYEDDHYDSDSYDDEVCCMETICVVAAIEARIRAYTENAFIFIRRERSAPIASNLRFAIFSPWEARFARRGVQFGNPETIRENQAIRANPTTVGMICDQTLQT